jgi:DNA-binding IclR family transcriptional regulator
MTNLPAAAADIDAKASMAEKVLLILEMVSHSEIPLTLENVSTGLGLAKPTAFRLLNTLNTLGFIERDFSGRRFQPGVRLRSIGTSMLFSDPIRAERIAAMKLLVDQIGETCNFNILDGNEVVYIDRIETNAPIRLHIHLRSGNAKYQTRCVHHRTKILQTHLHTTTNMFPCQSVVLEQNVQDNGPPN